MPPRKSPIVANELLDQLLAGSDAATALHDGLLLDSLKKALAERALNAELDPHLSQESQGNNSRNGYGKKTVTTGSGRGDLAIPRDRVGSFDPVLIRQISAALPRLRREDHLDVCAGYEPRARSLGTCRRSMASTSRPT